MKMSRTARWARHRGGAVALEYALILPALLLFIFGIIDIGRLTWTFTTLTRATEAAARCGAINLTDCGSTAQIQSRAVEEAWGLQINASAFTVTTESCGIQVVGSFDFVFAIPALANVAPLGTLTLKATACYPVMTTSSLPGSVVEHG